MQARRTDRSLDHIIGEALQRELESVPVPPAAPLWTRIRTGLARAGKKRAAFPWRQMAGAAALVLVFAGVGLALSRSGMFSSSPLFYGENVNQDCVKGDVAEKPSSMERGAAPPLALPGGFALEEEGAQDLIQAGEGWTAALYRRGEEKLLWISCDAPVLDLREFVLQAGRMLGAGTEIAGERTTVLQEGRLEFTAGGRPGIAWREGEGTRALLVLSGSPDLQALQAQLLPPP